ncbi:hypothetical protein HHI36_014914 [Cryptolaemus montrouzieri]|uniref:Uncharacterized protein n=1 Tax=Cryptolaemus montrouzieri TaxID=559131 RepID=A0ABD2N416_9CUCU
MNIYSTAGSVAFSINFEGFSQIPVMQFKLQEEWISFSIIKPDIYVIDASNGKLKEILRILEFQTIFNPSAKLYSYNPYEESDFNNVSTNIVQVGVCTNQTINYEENVFNPYVPATWNYPKLSVGCSYSPPAIITLPLFTNGHNFTGIDIEIIDTIAEKMKLRPYYELGLNYVGTKNNFSYDGVLGEVERRKFDLVVGGIYSTSDSWLDFDSSAPTVATFYSWFVPGPTWVPFWKRILLTFEPSVTITTLVLYILVSTMVHIFGYIQVTKQIWFNDFFKLFTILVGFPIRFSYSEKSSKRILYASWCLFSLVLNACFASKLLGNLMRKKFHYTIDSVDAITESNMNICILKGLEDGLREFEHRILTCTDCEICSNRTAFQRDLATIRTENLVDFFTQKYYLSENGDVLIHPLREKYLSVYNGMVFRKNHPVFKIFNKMLLRLINSGVADLIQMKHWVRFRKNISTEVNSAPLHLTQLKFIFQFLIYGLGMCSTIFIIEFMKKRISRTVTFIDPK